MHAALVPVLGHPLKQDDGGVVGRLAIRRGVIDQAIGVIMAEKRCAADVAFKVLRTGSQHRNVKLRQLAAEIIAGSAACHPSRDPPAAS